MAKYGKILPPPEPKETFKDGMWNIYARIYISLILLKLFIVIIIGDAY